MGLLLFRNLSDTCDGSFSDCKSFHVSNLTVFLRNARKYIIYYISLLAFGFLAFLRDMNIDQNALNGQVSVNEIGSPVEV